MDKRKAVSESEYIYEDKFSFVTEAGTVHRKESARQAEKQLGKIKSDDDIESVLVAYRGYFTSLEEKLHELESLSNEELSAWKSRLQESQGIGDFDKLYRRLDKLTVPGEEVMEKSVEEAEEDIAEDDNGNGSTVDEEDTAKTETEDNQVGPAAEALDDLSTESDANEANKNKTDEPRNIEADEEEITAVEEAVDEADEGITETNDVQTHEHHNEEEAEDETEAEDSANDQVEAKAEHDESDEDPAGASDEMDEEQEEVKADAEQDNPIAYYKQLTKEAQEVAKSEDWSKATQQLNELSHQWSDGPEVEDKDEQVQEKIKDLYYKFTKTEESFSKRREENYAKAEKQHKENLVKKKELLSDIEKIVNAEEWSATGKISKMERKWHGIGQVPKEQAGDIEEKYASLIKEFKSHKIDRLVEKRQKKEDNLMMKMAVLDKMEKVTADMDSDTIDWEKVDNAFSDLTNQWKKIGRVPRERANQVWDRYKSAQDAYYDNKYKYHKDHRSNVDSFTAKKENVIEDAEALLEQKDIAKAARKINKLHRRWKKIGNLPQRKEDDLWDRFKAATDAFNQRKADNQDKIEQQEEEHYQQKLELIEKAEEVKDTADWDKGHQQMQSMMDRWKKIGPVPRKKSGKIWKQFKGAMDVFYDRRREHFKEAKEEQKENLKEKEALLEKLRELGQHPDPIEAVNEAKKLQEEFKNVGYVPIKKKNEMWERYRGACDVIYDRMRAAKSGNKFDQELAKASLDPEQRSQIQDLRKEHSRVKKEVRSLKEEVLQLEESKSNFNFSDDDNPLLKDMQEKIQKAKARLESKQNKLEALSMEMEDIREEA